jgi:excisionase family DNA binding protein
VDARRELVSADEPRTWLTREDAAAYLAISPRTLIRQVAAGRIREYGIEGFDVIRYRLDELDAALEPIEPKGKP